MSASPSLEAARRDWQVLDVPLEDDGSVRLVAHERFTTPADAPVAYVAPASWTRLLAWWPALHAFLYAWRLLARTGRDGVLILNGAAPHWRAVGLVNRFLFGGRRRVLLYDLFVETTSPWKRAGMRAALRGIDLSVLWSRKQVPAHAAVLDLPEARFVYVPYKANHSKEPSPDLGDGGYVFSGGNGKRDYACLVQAVKGLGIPVIVSATDPKVRAAIPPAENVVPVAAWEPSFGRLQAASRMVVIPMVDTGLKGGGEANVLNGMWHGKPVIAVDAMMAEDYVEEGETGFIVAPGDAETLRRRIVELWDDPTRCVAMGRRGHERVAARYTHAHFIRRLVRLALLLGREAPA